MKLTSLTDQSKNPQFSENSISAAKQELKNHIISLNLDSIMIEYKKWSKIAVFLWAGLIISIIIAIIGFVITRSYVLGVIFAAIATACGFLAPVMTKKAADRKNSWKSRIEKSFNYNQMVKVLIEQKFENVKLPLEVKSQTWRSANYRSSDIPRDANISASIPGLALQINGFTVNTSVITWHWTRRSCNGRTCETHHYYKNNFYMFSSEYQERFDNFTYSMAKSGIFSNKGKELENDMFNKKFSYIHNDPLKLRVLLTPLIQETFVNEFNNFIESSTTCFVKEPKQYVLYKTMTKTPFSLDLKMQDSIDKTVDAVMNDIVDDAKYLLDNLSFIATFRELIK